MFPSKQIVLRFIAAITLTLAATPVSALSIEEINSIARQTTVLIAPGLTTELAEEIENNRNNPLSQKPEGVWNPGSGVIIAKEGKKYYVLTVAHNFSQRFVDADTPFGIRTSDRQVHVVQQINDGRGCPLSETAAARVLLRFGCRPSADKVEGFDLALVSFDSDKDYPVASLGDSNTVNTGDTVYISGWPDPEKEPTGELDQSGKPKCRGRVARRQRRLAWGTVAGKIDPAEQNIGYSIFYTDNTRAGMSGGPVFDSNGRVVGSHGQGRRGKPQCGGNTQLTAKPESDADLESETELESDVELESEIELESDVELESETELESPEEQSSPPEEFSYESLTQQYSSSQQVNFFLSLLKQQAANLPFNLDPPSSSLIKAGLTSIQATGESGKVEFDAKSDAFDDPKDVVDDVYKLYSFKLENMLRDCPSGGAGSLLLGDRDGCGE